MSDESQRAEALVPEVKSDYEAPAIEEVVSREGLEREVAYAGVAAPSGIN